MIGKEIILVYTTSLPYKSSETLQNEKKIFSSFTYLPQPVCTGK
jgi:hypothetical protein